MKNSLTPPSTARTLPSQGLQISVVVEASSIDFLNDGAMFVAGTNDCGCSISPMPRPKKGQRRSPAGNKR